MNMMNTLWSYTDIKWFSIPSQFFWSTKNYLLKSGLYLWRFIIVRITQFSFSIVRSYCVIHCGGPIDRCYGPRVSPITTVNLQLSWRWRNYQRFIPSFKVFGHLSFLIKTTFHSFVTFISIYCIGINRAYMYLTHIRTFAGKSPCMFIFFLFNKLSLLTVTLYLWKNKFHLIPCVSK